MKTRGIFTIPQNWKRVCETIVLFGEFSGLPSEKRMGGKGEGGKYCVVVGAAGGGGGGGRRWDHVVVLWEACGLWWEGGVAPRE